MVFALWSKAFTAARLARFSFAVRADTIYRAPVRNTPAIITAAISVRGIIQGVILAPNIQQEAEPPFQQQGGQSPACASKV